MESRQSGYFRSKDGFTVVQNAITRDVNISLKAKGLYLIIQANITNPNKKYKKDDFLKMTREGEKAFDSAWKELKEAGYLKVHNYPNGQKNKFVVEFELLDEPKSGPHTFYYNKDDEVTSTNVEHKEKCNQPKEEDLRGYQKGVPANGVPVKGVVPNGEDPKGVVPNGGTIVNTKSKDYSNPFIHSLNQNDYEGVSKETVHVSVDERLGKNETMDIVQEVSLGIDYKTAANPELMKRIIQVLVGWNDGIYESDYTETEIIIFVKVVEYLTQMATSKTPGNYKGSLVTYKNVIDILNEYITNSTSAEGVLVMWMTDLIHKIVVKMCEKKISNVSQYIKSMIWDHLQVYRLESNSRMF